MDAKVETKQRPRVLVVDDDAAIVSLVVAVLAEAGMEGVACHSGEEALALLAHEHVDLALLDIMMPGMDGLELCARIRQESDLPPSCS